LSEKGVFDKGFKFRSMVLPDFFIDQSSPEDMYKQAGLNANNIEDLVLALLGLETFKRANL
jgi:1-deoxy-D-xylulose-5-phosphate synthase